MSFPAYSRSWVCERPWKQQKAALSVRRLWGASSKVVRHGSLIWGASQWSGTRETG